MAASNTAVMDHFLVKEIPKQTGIPSWDIIQAINLNLNANAASVPSDLCGGQHGHLGLTIGGAEYQTLTGHAFTRPTNPGVTSPPGNPYELPAQQADCIQLWVNTVLRNQLTGAINKTYILRLKNQYTGYVQSTTMAILQHLYATYGIITPTKLEENDRAIKKDYDATLPIKHLTKQIETAVMVAGNANQPYTAAQPTVKKTWPNFKRHFAAAYADNIEEHTATRMGYGANAVQRQQGDLTEALEHLSNAALSDQAALANLTQANLTLTKQLEKTQEELDTLKNKNKNENNNVNNLTGGMHEIYYCWSHGITIKPNHT
eukprot:15315772-Ditylum_brightwellii.AAC.1